MLVLNQKNPESADAKILLALLSLEHDFPKRSSFIAEELVVRAWEQNQSLFGLREFESIHPSDNRVLACLMGAAGMIARGWVTKVGKKLYILSVAGKTLAQSFLATPEERASAAAASKDADPDAGRVKLPYTVAAFLDRAFDSSLWEKFRSGPSIDIGFLDLVRFFQIDDTMTAKMIRDKIDDAELTIANARKLVGTSECVLPSRMVIRQAQVASLADMCAAVQQRFAAKLSILLKHDGGCIKRIA